MGYAGKIQLRLKARDLRKAGFSIKAIEKKLGVSRSSVSLWVRDVKLSVRQIDKLYRNKRTGALRGSFIAAKNKIKTKEGLVRRLLNQGKQELGRMSERDRFIAGVALYFAEGEKASEHIGFSNSDYRAIKFMVDWFRHFCNIPNNKFRCNIYIHDDLDEMAAKRFWSGITKVPFSQFGKSYIVKNNSGRFRRTRNIYGVLRIATSNVVIHRKIMGWIEGIFNPL